MELKINDLFSDKDLSNYDLFIEKLKQIRDNGHTTKEILELVYQYYRKYVTYNYDQLQIVKIINYNRHKEINDVVESYPLKNLTEENAETIKNGYINDLNSAFQILEGKPLTQRTIDRLFSSFGKVVHHEARDYEFCGKKKHKDAYDEIQGVNTTSFPAVYNNGMLQEGVCGDYSKGFEKKICEDLGIRHLTVTGVGTTGHGWSLIYLPEEQRWVHFDMTMVKFYQDGWIKEHEPYKEQDWVTATTEDIFKMQPTRRIESIGGKSCSYDKDNYSELDISKFDCTILPSEIGKSTIDVPVTQKVEAQTSVNLDSQIHGLEEKQVESLDGE